MNGKDAAKLTFEGHWVRRKSWVKYWPCQFITDIHFLVSETGDESYLKWQENPLVRFQVGAWDNGKEDYATVNYAEYIPLNENEWEADDWEVYDRSSLPGQ